MRRLGKKTRHDIYRPGVEAATSVTIGNNDWPPSTTALYNNLSLANKCKASEGATLPSEWELRVRDVAEEGLAFRPGASVDSSMVVTPGGRKYTDLLLDAFGRVMFGSYVNHSRAFLCVSGNEIAVTLLASPRLRNCPLAHTFPRSWRSAISVAIWIHLCMYMW